jgi:hypothetical protein
MKGKAREVNPSDDASALRRFMRSMVIDFEKWHDGIGYDRDALHDATPAERDAIETILIAHQPRDWRDIEALIELGTPRAKAAIREAMTEGDIEVQMAILDSAPELIPYGDRVAAVVRSLRTAGLFGGLSRTLDVVEQFHPPEVIDELFRGLLEREGEVAVNFAGMLIFIHGKSADAFDMKLRPFFLRFNTENASERADAFRELCRMIGVDARKYQEPKTKRTR